MHRLAIALCAALLAAAPGLAQQSAQESALLTGMVDHSRPLLIFAGASDPRVQQQYRELANNTAGVQDRQIRPVFVTATQLQPDAPVPTGTVSATVPEQAILRSQFHVPANTFAVVLIGKDGGEKLRSSTPIPFTTLAHTIDAMPMRQREMRAH